MNPTNTPRPTIGKHQIAVILTAAFLMAAAAFIQYFYMRSSIHDAAVQAAKSDLMVSCQQIEARAINVETAVNTMSHHILQNANTPDAMYEFALQVLLESPQVRKCVIAFPKGYFSPAKDSLYAPYAERSGSSYNKGLTADYLNESWFADPVASKQPQWSDPYIGEKHTMFVSYSRPVVNPQGKVIAVLAAHIPMDSLTTCLDGIKSYPNSAAILTSRHGDPLMGDSIPAASQDDAVTFNTSIGKVGWNLTMICPNEDIDQKTQTVRWVVLIMQVVGLLLLLFIVIDTVRHLRQLRRTTQERNRMGDELQDAKDMQFAASQDALPEHERLDVAAIMRNGSEVGGDFYDCFIEHNRLHFCIGDVAGKGAPAALLMSMARSAFRVAANHQEKASQIISEVNRLICQMNDNKTTIKMTGGILDLQTGALQYCNAGMHAPYLLTADACSPLGETAENRIGVSPDTVYEEQSVVLDTNSTLFLYTDGLTEAEDQQHHQWGTKRLKTVLDASLSLNAQSLADRVSTTVRKHVGRASLPDDMSLLVIRYTAQS